MGYQWSNYNAAIDAKVEQRLREGLSYIAFLHAFEMHGYDQVPGQNMYNRRLERGSCDSRRARTISPPATFAIFPSERDVPSIFATRFSTDSSGGWEFSGIKSFHYGLPADNQVTTGDIANVGTGVPARQRNRYSAGETRSPYKRTCSASILPPTVFPPTGTFGNLSRNTQRGFGLNNWDMGINKNFAIPQFLGIGTAAIRAEFFNIFNHTQFNGMGTFGQPARNLRDREQRAASADSAVGGQALLVGKM